MVFKIQRLMTLLFRDQPPSRRRRSGHATHLQAARPLSAKPGSTAGLKSPRAARALHGGHLPDNDLLLHLLEVAVNSTSTAAASAPTSFDEGYGVGPRMGSNLAKKTGPSGSMLSMTRAQSSPPLPTVSKIVNPSGLLWHRVDACSLTDPASGKQVWTECGLMHAQQILLDITYWPNCCLV